MNTKALKVFFIYTIVLALFVIISIFALYILKSRAVYLFAIKLYGLFEFSLLAYFLYYLFKNIKAKRVVLFSILPFTIFSLISYFFSQNKNFSNYPSLIEFLIFIIFIIYYFYEKMNTDFEFPLYQSISFWICMGLFIFFTGNFFFILFINSSKDKHFLSQMSVVYSIVTICKNIILCIAFVANERIENYSEKDFQIPNELDLDSFTPNHNLN